ncbi:MAG TPA: vitamin K epoxide reductase family protein [Candidatus Gastranaerophilaceae bacterium]|nr:vitamin K epoxide reductase family protein [Candidatus Gastranaerophilaceae bacterium]
MFNINVTVVRKIVIFILAVIGFATTVKLSVIYYDSNFNPYALPSFCSINQFVDCDGVAQTVHSQFLGIPLALWGLLFYIFTIFLLFVNKLKHVKFLHFLKVFKHPMRYICALGLISFLISMILASISIFEIKKICILCVFTYFLNLFIAYAAVGKAGFYHSFKISTVDFIHALRIKKYLISFIVLALIAGGVLAYTATSYVLAPQVKRYKSIKSFADMKTNPFKSGGNTLGDKNAKIIIDVYTDYRCPICYTFNIMVYRMAKELGNIKFIHHNLPLDEECNHYVRQEFHEGACMLAKYSVAAQNQGHLWDFNSELFEKQPKTEDDILKLAKSLGYDTIRLRQDANSKDTSDRIQKDIENSIDLGIIGTPTMVMNGKIMPGIKPYYEFKEMLIKAGAVEKR